MSTLVCINLERSAAANFQEIPGGGTAFLEEDNQARYSLIRRQRAGLLRNAGNGQRWSRENSFIIPERDCAP